MKVWVCLIYPTKPFFPPPAHRLRMQKEALQAQNSLIHLLEAAIHLLEYEACGRGEWSGHGGKIGFANSGSVPENQLEPGYKKKQASTHRLMCTFL